MQVTAGHGVGTGLGTGSSRVCCKEEEAAKRPEKPMVPPLRGGDQIAEPEDRTLPKGVSSALSKVATLDVAML